MKYLTAQMHIAQSNSFFKIGNLAQIVILSGFPGNEANCSYVAGIKFVEIVKVLVLTKTHKRNQEWDQVGHWTPLEGAKVYFRRSQNLPWIR